MHEPFFPTTGKRVVPISEIETDDEITAAGVRQNRSTRRNVSLLKAATVTVLAMLILDVGASSLATRSKSNSKKVVTSKKAKASAIQEYELLPASLIQAYPYPQYTLTVPSGRWVDTRILVRRSQEIWIEYTDDSPGDSWAIKTNAGDETLAPEDSRIVSNRWEDTPGLPVDSDAILGDLSQDTLKISLYWKDGRPITVNITVKDKQSIGRERQ